MPKIFHSFVNPVSDQVGLIGTKPSNWNAPLQYGNFANTGPNGIDVALRQSITSDTNYYVNNVTGSDSNPGTIAQPFSTLQFAWDFLSSILDLASFNLTINCAASAIPYTLTIGNAFVGGKNVNLLGAGSAVTTLKNFFSQGALVTPVLNISRFTMTSDPGVYGLLSVSIGNMYLAAINQLTDNDIVFVGTNQGPNNSLAAIRFDQVGVILNVGGNITFKGTFDDMIIVSDGAQAFGNGVTFTMSGTPTWTGSFMNCFNDGIWIDGGSTYTGAGTGKRFSVTTNAVIDAQDATGTLFPGNSGGVIESGGEYTGITDYVGHVAGLPAAVKGAKAYVDDSLNPIFASIAAGGGAVFTPVYGDGTNWRWG